MGKKQGGGNSVARLPIITDRSVFGNLVIAQQSPMDDNGRFARSLFAQPPSDIGNVRPRSGIEARRVRSQSDARDFNERQGTIKAMDSFQPRRNTIQSDVEPSSTCANQRELRRCYSHESATRNKNSISPPPAVLRRNPDYYGSVCSSSTSLPSSSDETGSSDVFRPSSPPPPLPPRWSPAMSRGSSIEEVEDESCSPNSVLSFSSSTTTTEHPDGGKRRVSFLVDELLYDIYERSDALDAVASLGSGNRRRRNSCESEESASSFGGVACSRFDRLRGRTPFSVNVQRARLEHKGVEELRTVLRALRYHVQYVGALLVKELKRRESLVSRRDKQYDVITAFLQAHSEKRTVIRERNKRTVRCCYKKYSISDEGHGRWFNLLSYLGYGGSNAILRYLTCHLQRLLWFLNGGNTCNGMEFKEQQCMLAATRF